MIPVGGKQYRFGAHTITFAHDLRVGDRFRARHIIEIDGIAPKAGDRVPTWLGRPDNPASPLSKRLRADMAANRAINTK